MEKISKDIRLAHGDGYSAEVHMHLRVNGSTFGLAQTSRDFIILDEPRALPEGPAEVIIVVDGQEIRREVCIENRDLMRKVVPVRATDSEGQQSVTNFA